MHYFQVLPAIMIIAMFIALAQWSLIPRPRKPVFRLFGINIMLALALELTGLACSFFSINISAAYSLFGMLESLIVLCMVLVLHRRWKPIVIAAMAVTLCSMCINYLLSGSLSVLLIEGILMNLLVVTLIIMAVLWNMAQTSLSPLTTVPEFWLFTSLLVYFSALIPLFGLVPIIFEDDEIVAYRLFKIAPVIATIRYLMAAWACRMEARRESAERMELART